MIQKIFIGFKITKELRMHLEKSLAYSLAKIGEKNGMELIETHFQGQDYLGLFLQGREAFGKDLKDLEPKMQEKLKNYCPHFSCESAKLLIFPLVFLGDQNSPCSASF